MRVATGKDTAPDYIQYSIICVEYQPAKELHVAQPTHNMNILGLTKCLDYQDDLIFHVSLCIIRLPWGLNLSRIQKRNKRGWLAIYINRIIILYYYRLILNDSPNGNVYGNLVLP